MEEEKKKVNVDNFSVCQSTSHKNGIEKANQYGGNLFEQRQQWVAENQSNNRSSGIEKGYQWGRPVMVGTFLNKNSNGLQKIRVTTNQVESEKVTNGDAQLWWEPF